MALVAVMAACSSEPLVVLEDAGTMDASAADAAVMDAGTMDAGTMDASAADAAVMDAGDDAGADMDTDAGPPLACQGDSLLCSTAADCCPNASGDATCEAVGGGLSQCVAPCSSDDDCIAGWCCFADPTTGDRCVPPVSCGGAP